MDDTSSGIIRRVSAAEVRRRLGCGETWLRIMISQGRWPEPMRDVHGRRRWWLSHQVDSALLALAERATTTTSSKPVLLGAEPRARRAAKVGRGSSTGTPTSPDDEARRAAHTIGHTQQDAGVRRGSAETPDGTDRT